MCHASWAHRRPHGFSHFQGFFSRPQPHGWEGSMPPWSDEGFGSGGGFGVRRPLRFLAHKLELDDKQVLELARILDELKTERAQSAVDDRRTLADFADALAGEQFDTAKAAVAGDRRVESSKRLRDTLIRLLGQIHAMLNPEQRARLAHLIRTGILAV
jgi:Spy/CpxP family protein refolding chaperone